MQQVASVHHCLLNGFFTTKSPPVLAWLVVQILDAVSTPNLESIARCLTVTYY